MSDWLVSGWLRPSVARPRAPVYNDRNMGWTVKRDDRRERKQLYDCMREPGLIGSQVSVNGTRHKDVEWYVFTWGGSESGSDQVDVI